MQDFVHQPLGVLGAFYLILEGHVMGSCKVLWQQLYRVVVCGGFSENSGPKNVRFPITNPKGPIIIMVYTYRVFGGSK